MDKASSGSLSGCKATCRQRFSDANRPQTRFLQRRCHTDVLGSRPGLIAPRAACTARASGIPGLEKIWCEAKKEPFPSRDTKGGREGRIRQTWAAQGSPCSRNCHTPCAEWSSLSSPAVEGGSQIEGLPLRFFNNTSVQRAQRASSLLHGTPDIAKKQKE